MTSDPIRLLSQSDLTTSERMALEAGELGVSVDYDFARGEARLLASLATLSQQPSVPGQPSLAPPRARLLSKLGIKTLLGLTLGLALMGAAYVLSARPSVRSRARGHASYSEAVEVQQLEPVRPVVTSLAPSEPAPATVPAIRQDVRRADSRRRPIPEASQATAALANEASQPVAANPVETATDPRAELRAIAQAKTLTARDPQAALRLLEQIRVQFPHGYFGEERAALTILALSRSGQSALARQQAAGFLARYPNGTHSDRVRRAVEAGGSAREQNIAVP